MNRLFNLKNRMVSPFYKMKNQGTFEFDGITFPFFNHWYNHTWTNSRMVEVPIFQYLLSKYKGQQVLEVGNVLGHYQRYYHDVLDKYEVAPGVINEDIVDYKPEWKYNVVLSCSTLEHVGFDEEVKDPKKFIKAIENIKENILTPHGVLWFSVPVGYNPWLDAIMENKLVRLDEMIHFKRGTWEIIIGKI